MIIDGHNVAGNGTTALGIIGTTLGGAALAANNGVLGNILGARQITPAASCYETSPVCVHDLDMVKQLYEKDSELSRLKSEQYTNGVANDLRNYVDRIFYNGYKEVKADISGVNDKINENATAQAVINATVNSGLSTLAAQAEQTAAIVAKITKTAVPKSAICNFGCGCTSDD